MKIFMKSNRGDGYEAYGEYDNGKVVVKKGSRIRLSYADNFHRARQVVNYRDDPTCVDTNGIVLKNCRFNSSSTAAQFVSGQSTDGYIAWHLDEKTRLGDWIKQGKEKAD